MTASSGNFAIESHGIFEDTEGFFSGDAMDKTLIELTTFGLLPPTSVSMPADSSL